MSDQNKGSSEDLEQAMAEALASVERHEGGGQDAEQAEESTFAPEAGEDSGEAEVSADIEELKGQLLRMAADFDNFRKRSRRELDEAQERGKERLLLDLLPAFDNLERAVAHADSDPETLADGVRMVAKQFGEALRQHEVEGFDSVGESFDPEWHEAMSQLPTEDYAPGTVAAEIKRGYRIGARLLRPAQVMVATAPQQPNGDSDDNGEEA